MIRNIERLPKRVYLFVVLLLIASCLLATLLMRKTSDPVESAKTLLGSIPLYPGATQVSYTDSDMPGSKLSHQLTGCSIECARVIYDIPDRPEDVIRFYEHWANTKRWRVNPTYGENAFARNYGSGPIEFRGLRPSRILGIHLWFYAHYEPTTDHIIGVVADGKVRGITSVEVTVGRMRPMPSDTPIPTLVPPPPTAPIPIVPGSVRTQQPNIPFPQPTAP